MKLTEIIYKKKINPSVAGILLYLSFCMSGLYLGRGEWGYTTSGMANIAGMGIIANVYVAFFVCGLLPFLVYEIITGFTFKILRPRFGIITEDLRYALRFFYFFANIIVALFSLLYFISPIISVYGDLFVPFIAASVLFALYIKFIFSNYIEKSRRGAILLHLGGVYVIFYSFIAVLNLLGMVIV